MENKITFDYPEAQPIFAESNDGASQTENKITFDYPEAQPIFAESNHAPVAKLVDAPDLGSGNSGCVGSSPIRRTTQNLNRL